MTTAAVNMGTCTTCGKTLPMHTLLMNDQGALTCASCLAAREMNEGSRKRAKNHMLAPAMISTLAYFSFLVPFWNLFGPGLLAASAIWGAIGGIRLNNELARAPGNQGVSSGLRTGLLVMSILTIIFASLPLLLQIFAWIGLALAPSHPRPGAW
jgi:hypothetical protein